MVNAKVLLIIFFAVSLFGCAPLQVKQQAALSSAVYAEQRVVGHPSSNGPFVFCFVFLAVRPTVPT